MPRGVPPFHGRVFSALRAFRSPQRFTFLLFALDCSLELLQHFYYIADLLTSQSCSGIKSQPLFLGELMVSGHLLKDALHIFQHSVSFTLPLI